jgi:hypothetical protein
MEPVAIGELPTELLGQQRSDRRLPRPEHTCDKYDHAPALPPLCAWLETLSEPAWQNHAGRLAPRAKCSIGEIIPGINRM